MRRRVLGGASLALLLALALPACGRQTSASGGTQAQSIRIVLTDFRITSSATTFKAGRPYHFIVTNQGHTSHEFMIMPTDLGAMGGMSMAAMDRMAVASLADFPAGQTRTLDYMFPMKMAGSHPEFTCYDPEHYELGMHMEVSVTR